MKGMCIKVKKNEQIKHEIDEKLKGYNENIGLVHEYCTPNYHSRLNPGEHYFINSSTKLAAAIFFNEYAEKYNIANDLLKNVVKCQCKEGELTGLWSYYYEESLEEMVAPDGNFADFNAIPMLAVLKEQADKLDDEVRKDVEEACVNACHAIIKRDLTIIYTNPCIMDMYVTIVCGEMLSKPDFVEYGKNKLDRMYRHIMENKTFDEYNCTGYSLLIADIFSIMLRHISDEEVQKKVKELNMIVWKMIGEHFHFKTGEICGPNLRRYTNFLNGEGGADIEKATETDIVGTYNENYGMMDAIYDKKCPEEILHVFREKNTEKNFVKMINRGSNYPWFSQASVDMHYMCEDYCLGSFSLSDAWNQHVYINGYIGDRKEKCCLRMRVLHNKYDFCSAFIGTLQEKNAAVSVVNFHTNRGDTHVDLDPVINSTIKATDLRVRWQIEANIKGVIEKINVIKKENSCILQILGTDVEISYPFAEISGEEPYFEISQKGKELFVDMVLYSGEEKEINLAKLESAVVVTYITIGDGKVDSIKFEKDAKYLNTTCSICGKKAEIKALFAPAEQIPSVMATELRLNGERIERIGEK